MTWFDAVCEAIEREVETMHVTPYEAWYVVAGARIAMQTLGVPIPAHIDGKSTNEEGDPVGP